MELLEARSFGLRAQISFQISLPLWSPIMMKCGRRVIRLSPRNLTYPGILLTVHHPQPAFLAGAVLMVIGAVVTACATTQNTLIAGRAILGIGMGPAECLAVALVADLFYVVSSALSTTKHFHD